MKKIFMRFSKSSLGKKKYKINILNNEYHYKD